MKLLEHYPAYLDFKNRVRVKSASPAEIAERDDGRESKQTPKDAIELNYAKLKQALAQELLSTIRHQSPAFFEQLVVELLVKMGYGGSIRDAGQAIGRTGDEGIDGIIKEDKLGLDVIYIQAKRWDRTIGRPEIQQFAGALQGQRARKGVFISTSSFTNDARNFAAGIDSKIVLIDGEQLAQLMIDNNVGVTVDTVYELKRIDGDYFSTG
jgi:restriction system protein